jgi:hypothetical protein
MPQTITTPKSRRQRFSALMRAKKPREATHRRRPCFPKKKLIVHLNLRTS